MNLSLSAFFSLFFKAGAVALVINEIRGLILAVPVLYGMYQAGGSLMAIWIGFCSLGGIALSVIVPLFAARRVQAFIDARQHNEPVPAGSKSAPVAQG